mmetsp:Transcript_31873/g.91475  ORF Transcript_31873/g.91475 Transcript_31873/m.91475 type:complete len:256 (-) Transcript_31873:138-905(-)
MIRRNVPTSDLREQVRAWMTTRSSLKNCSRRTMRRSLRILRILSNRTKATFFIAEAAPKARFPTLRITSIVTSTSCTATNTLSKTFHCQPSTVRKLRPSLEILMKSSVTKITQKSTSTTRKPTGAVSTRFLAKKSDCNPKKTPFRKMNKTAAASTTSMNWILSLTVSIFLPDGRRLKRMTLGNALRVLVMVSDMVLAMLRLPVERLFPTAGVSLLTLSAGARTLGLLNSVTSEEIVPMGSSDRMVCIVPNRSGSG